MSDHPLLNIRMHASRQGRHLSGGERLAGGEELDDLALALLRRALEHPRGADRISLTVEALSREAIRRGRLPDVHTFLVDDYRQGRQAAMALLRRAGVGEAAARAAFAALSRGPAPDGGNMRGAMLIDAASGARLEADPARGVRASRMDLSPEAARELDRELTRLGLDRRRVREALVLAAKVMATPGIVAELCWSDDPDYTAGYVAAPGLGYLRLPHLKPAGEGRGGRAFFLRCSIADLAAVVTHLQLTPVLFEEIGRFHPPRAWEGSCHE